MNQLRVTPGIRQSSQSNLDFDGDGINDPYYKPGFVTLNMGYKIGLIRLFLVLLSGK